MSLTMEDVWNNSAKLDYSINKTNHVSRWHQHPAAKSSTSSTPRRAASGHGDKLWTRLPVDVGVSGELRQLGKSWLKQGSVMSLSHVLRRLKLFGQTRPVYIKNHHTLLPKKPHDDWSFLHVLRLSTSCLVSYEVFSDPFSSAKCFKGPQVNCKFTLFLLHNQKTISWCSHKQSSSRI
jgi:hypothetical protein